MTLDCTTQVSAVKGHFFFCPVGVKAGTSLIFDRRGCIIKFQIVELIALWAMAPFGCRRTDCHGSSTLAMTNFSIQ